MSALPYLYFTCMKNAVLQLFRKPVVFLFGVFWLTLMILVVFSANSSAGTLTDQRFLYMQAGSFLILGFISFSSFAKGLNQGSTFFSMPDVNILFTSPIHPMKVLLYGTVRQMGVSAIASLFLLLQIPNLRNFLHLGTAGIFGVISGWFLLLFCNQVLSVSVYSLTAPFPRKRYIGKTIMYCTIGLLGLWYVIYILWNGGEVSSLFRFFGQTALDFLPVVGWTNAYVMHMAVGDYPYASLFLTLMIFLPALGILMMKRSHSEYYEDVLQTTENAFHMKLALKDGKASGRNLGSKVRTGQSGIVGKGKGASTFFYRHLTEHRRTGWMILEKSSFLIVGIAVVAGLIFRNLLLRGEISILSVEIIAACGLGYILYFFTITGKFTQELTKHYIYLVPAENTSKIVFANLSTVLKALYEGGIAFLAFTLICGLPLWYAPLAALLYTSLSQLYVSVSILTQRVTGTASKLFSGLIYMICAGVLMIPGAVLFVISMILLNQMSHNYTFVAFLISASYNVSISALVLLFGRNIFDRMES